MALVGGMTNLPYYDMQDLDRVVSTVIIAQESLQHDCIPSYSEATQELGIVKLPFRCGLEITHNTMSQKITFNESTFDLLIEPDTMSWMRTNFITTSK